MFIEVGRKIRWNCQLRENVLQSFLKNGPSTASFSVILSIQKKHLLKFLRSNFSFISNFWRQLMKPKNLIFLIWRFPGKHHPDFHRVEHEPVLQQQGQDGGNRPVRTGQWIIPFFQRNPPLIRERERNRREKDLLWDSYQMGNFFRFLEKMVVLKSCFFVSSLPIIFHLKCFDFFIKLNVMQNRWT